jgi:hypothetical protein
MPSSDKQSNPCTEYMRRHQLSLQGIKGFTKQYTIALLHHILIPSLAILVVRKEAHVQNFPAYEISISINIRIQKPYEHKQAWSNL